MSNFFQISIGLYTYEYKTRKDNQISKMSFGKNQVNDCNFYCHLLFKYKYVHAGAFVISTGCQVFTR